VLFVELLATTNPLPPTRLAFSFSERKSELQLEEQLRLRRRLQGVGLQKSSG
jgi:hypothetical protein